jgi:cell division protein FtsW
MIRWPASLSLSGWRSWDTPAVKVQRRAAIPMVDVELLVCAGLLMLLGTVMVYSATIALPDSPKFAAYKPWHFLLRHTFSVFFAIGVGLAVFAVPMQRWQKYAPSLFVFGLLLLALVLFPGIGKTVYGARRWISLGFINLQPSELMKIFVLLYAANFVVRKQGVMHKLSRGFVPLAVAMGVVGGLLLLEPDLGAYMVMVVVAMCLLFIGGLGLVWSLGLVGILSLVFGAIIWLSPWRRERMFAYLDPFEENNVTGKGYQLAQSLMAFGRGEFTGVGLGGSVGKLHYLPEAHTDFLLAVVGEELGLIGVMIVIFLFYRISRRAFEIGRQAIVVDSSFAGLVAMGVGIWLGVQAFMNIGVNLGLLPTKGLTLPFMSYGGSAIVANCFGLALLLRIDYESKRKMRGSDK